MTDQGTVARDTQIIEQRSTAYEHHGEEAGGAVAGAVGGAVLGTVVGGPVGTVIGGAVGAVAGATAGKADEEHKDTVVEETTTRTT
jgi:outer membrane lipoprotein SlyB